jgi:hypothetical protein
LVCLYESQSPIQNLFFLYHAVDQPENRRPLHCREGIFLAALAQKGAFGGPPIIKRSNQAGFILVVFEASNVLCHADNSYRAILTLGRVEEHSPLFQFVREGAQ